MDIDASDIDGIVRRLASLGFDDNEAQVYVHLLRLGPCKVSELARVLDIHRTTVYRTLRAMEDRGVVRGLLGKTARYEAVEPGRLFRDLLREHERELDRVERTRSELAPVLEALRAEAAESPAERSTWRVVEGRIEILRDLDRMLAGAQRSVLGLVLPPLPKPYPPEVKDLRDQLLARARDGVRCRLVMSVDPDILEGYRREAEDPVWEKTDVQMRFAASDRPVRLFVVDERQALVWMRICEDAGEGPGDEAVALWTDVPDFVSAQLFHFERAWERARPPEELAAAVEARTDAAAGPDP